VGLFSSAYTKFTVLKILIKSFRLDKPFDSKKTALVTQQQKEQ
jgi:hypothetical protein